MGAASSVATSSAVAIQTRSSQCSAEEQCMCSQACTPGGSAVPILVVYIYANPKDTVAHAAAVELAQQQMPVLCDMAAGRGVRLFTMPVDSEQQLLDANDAFSMFTERCSHSLLAFVSDTDGGDIGLPAQLPLAFVHRCIAALKKRRPEAAEFLCDTLSVLPAPSSLTSCFSDGLFLRDSPPCTFAYQQFTFLSQTRCGLTLTS